MEWNYLDKNYFIPPLPNPMASNTKRGMSFPIYKSRVLSLFEVPIVVWSHVPWTNPSNNDEVAVSSIIMPKWSNPAKHICMTLFYGGTHRSKGLYLFPSHVVVYLLLIVPISFAKEAWSIVVGLVISSFASTLHFPLVCSLPTTDRLML